MTLLTRGMLMTRCMKENVIMSFDMHDMHALTVILVCVTSAKALYLLAVTQ